MRFIFSLALACSASFLAVAQTTQPAQPLDSHAAARAVAARLTAQGAQFLLAAQATDGGWAPETGPGVSSLVLRALIQEPTVGPNHPAVRKGVDFVLRFQRDDGGIYFSEGLHKNYESSVALSMLAALPPGPYTPQVERLQKFLKDNQWDEGDGKSIDDAWYGGAGYGNHARPDLSNTQMMVEALHDSGLPPDDPAYQKALVFISRCQMLGETNDQPYARGSTQGGFIYTCANSGESKADTLTVDGREELRAYGTMTYAGLKSMVYAGLKKDDPRVQAALDWIRQNWTLDRNPAMPAAQAEQGLYYYYHVFGRALAALGDDEIQDERGRPHDWRTELTRKLQETQHEDGRWVNEADRWMEGLPPLTTAYSMLALEAAFPQP